jgi:hypothetical protein
MISIHAQHELTLPLQLQSTANIRGRIKYQILHFHRLTSNLDGGAARCRAAGGDGERLEGRGRVGLHVRSGARLQVPAAPSWRGRVARGYRIQGFGAKLEGRSG